LKLQQDTAFPEEEATTLTVQAKKPVMMSVHIRVPYWATRGFAVKVNGVAQTIPATPSSYVAITREWKNGDKIHVAMPMHLHEAPLLGAPNLRAAMYGPLVLAGRFGNEGLTHNMIYGPSGPRLRPGPSPEVRSNGKAGLDWVEPAPSGKLAFRLAGQTEATQLKPLYQILDERYAVYWKVNSEAAKSS
jgi:hypothetical protein